MHNKAFCIELKKIVSSEEVWGYYYEKKVSTKSLTFKCPDPSCEAQLILRNCAPYLDSYEASFRRYPRSLHKTDCSLMEYQEKEKKKKAKARKNFSIFR